MWLSKIWKKSVPGSESSIDAEGEEAEMQLRMAVPKDSKRLLAIYEHYIHTTVTFEYQLPTEEAFAQRISHVLETYPYLVLEEDGRTLGYAYAHRLAERAAYEWSAELSIYLHPEITKRNYGRKLYEALMELLRLQGIRTVYGLVSVPNPSSEAFHKKLGFHLAGQQRNVGYKNGKWLGVSYFEKFIAPYDPKPQPVIPVGRLPAQTVQRVLNQYE